MKLLNLMMMVARETFGSLPGSDKSNNGRALRTSCQLYHLHLQFRGVHSKSPLCRSPWLTSRP